ncbi:hypothetical protein [Saccharothrix texasensis]|nr:hypothetical protein [Saccharothrix texasensis]
MDTIGGQSGSAVCDTYCAVAVHAYGHTSHNRGTRVVEEVRRNLLARAR